jgi:isoleucyl-tRNA synthetase
MENTENKKSDRALKEEAVLNFWQANQIFEKTLAKPAPKGEFVFFEGPPTANAKPALHHLEARVFKDALPRYKTMRGYRVPRQAGWDTHGLPVELQIEKKLGLKSKKEIEQYGVERFNKECKDSVFDYISDWETFTERIGYWVDLKKAYYTFDNSYIETLWSILGEVEKKKLLYKDYKVLPWCPRCGTALSSHELAQGYQDVKDLSVYAKFKIKGFPDAYFLAWTTTPWTLPGNVALAVGADIDYVEVKVGNEILVLAEERLALITEPYEVIARHKGSEMVGMAYEPLYPFLKESYKGEGLEKAYKVYAADFVNTTDGTGIVHTAVMYGQDDFELGTKLGLPKHHIVDETGHFKPEAGIFAGKFVKDEETAVEVIKDLAPRGLLFKKEKYEHSYPHCWRCKTPLIYYARDSWYIAMSKLRDELVKENEGINWEPAYIKEGRFGEWLREIKDWAISRERYWGTPLPIWQNKEGKRIIADSLATLKQYAKKSGNTYLIMRHGETVGNTQKVWRGNPATPDSLTEEGRKQVKTSAATLKGTDFDYVFISQFGRARETAEIVLAELGLPADKLIVDPRLGEWNAGAEFELKPIDHFFGIVEAQADKYNFKTADGESFAEVVKRIGAFLYELEATYQDKKILIITHGGLMRGAKLVAQGFTYKGITQKLVDLGAKNAEVRKIEFTPLPHNDRFELDLHRPFIDEVVLEKDGEEYRRVKEVMDVWFDSGAMPFAQDPQHVRLPADFISEAIDQTRGWFYTLHAIGTLMGKGKVYKNVICLGHILDKEGKKMSKSVGNVVNPWEMIDKYGVDTLRLWMYSVNQPGEGKNFDERTVDELQKRVFNLLDNVFSFYELYRDRSLERVWRPDANHILDRWVLARLDALTDEMTKKLDQYELLTPTRELRRFVDDLSTWYVRRSRERIKEGDREAKQTLYYVLREVAKLMAPFTPFVAEDLYQKLRVKTDVLSVHLESWPETRTAFWAKLFSQKASSMLGYMDETRRVISAALEARNKANIKVRQPLSKLTIKMKLSPEYLEIIKDELNVKTVVVDPMLTEEVLLDTTLTPELLEEGKVRDAIRKVQEWRKEQNLKPGQSARYTVPAGEEAFFAQHAAEIKKAGSIEF